MGARYARAWITGGSRGIGLTLARRLLADGTHVAIVARNADQLSQAREDLLREAPAGARCDSFVADVAESAQVQAAFRRAQEAVGDPDLVAHVAGGSWPQRFATMTEADFDRTIRVNLYGTFHVARAAMEPLLRAKGRLLNVASVAGLIGVYGFADYCASKFGVVGFSEALRQELHPQGVAVHVLCPPDTDTPGFAAENKTKPAATKALSANAKVLTPDAVVDAALRGMARGRFLIVPGASAKLTHLAKRWAPGVVDLVVRRTIASVEDPSS